MVNAQEWLNNLYPTAEAKAAVKRIGPKENPQKRIETDLLSVFTKGRDPLSTLLLSVDSILKKNHQIDDNLNLEGPLSLKGFFNLEELVINNQKITALLDISDCSKLRDLSFNNNQLENLNVSNNKQLEYLSFDNNQISNLDLTGLTKIEKIFCSGNKLTSLKFLEGLDHTKVLTLRMENNKFPPQDLKFFGRFTNLQRLFIGGNPFYGSLKPLWNLNNLKGIGIANTDIDGGLEYLPEDFFNVNAAAAGLGFRGGYFTRSLHCSGKLAEKLKDYKVENDPLRNYDWDIWMENNQDLVEK